MNDWQQRVITLAGMSLSAAAVQKIARSGGLYPESITDTWFIVSTTVARFHRTGLRWTSKSSPVYRRLFAKLAAVPKKR